MSKPNLFRPIETLRHPGTRKQMTSDVLAARYAMSTNDQRKVVFVHCGWEMDRAAMAAHLRDARRTLRSVGA